MLTQTLFDLTFLTLTRPSTAAAAGETTLPSDVQFGTLVRWFDADSYSATRSDGDQLSSSMPWTDKSLNTQSSTPVNTAKPVFKTNQFGTKPAVLFTSPFARMNHPATITFAGDFTFIIVTTGSNDTILIGENGLNYQVRICTSGTNKNSFFPNGGSVITSNLLSASIGTGKANVWMRSGSNVTFWENSASAGGGSNGGTYLTDILGSDDGGPLNSCNVGVVLMYSYAMADSVYLDLYTNYLKPHFSLPW
jgi:hypothetical protein